MNRDILPQGIQILGVHHGACLIDIGTTEQNQEILRCLSQLLGEPTLTGWHKQHDDTYGLRYKFANTGDSIFVLQTTEKPEGE